MANEPTCSPVYRAMNRPLTICGAERKLFFLALVIGGATFNFFGSLLGGFLMFAALYVFARWATANDPQLLHIVFSASKFKARFDPAQRSDFTLQRVRS